MIIGIDFGTCFSSVAVMLGSRPIANFMDEYKNQGIPSAFMYDKTKGEEL